MSENAAAPRLALVGLLAIQAAIGYEWVMSGLTKIVRGGFPSGLAAELREKSEGAPGWYRSFLDGTAIPNATAFGYVIEIGELAIGVALIAAAALWLLRWNLLSARARSAVLMATVVASLGGVFMNVNFHLANGSPHPWLIPGDGFDEGVDLDSLMPAIQLVLAGVSSGLWLSRRRVGARVAALRGRQTASAG